MATKKTINDLFQKGTDILIYPFAFKVLKNTIPPRKTLDIYSSIARMAVEPLREDLPNVDLPNIDEYQSFGEDTVEEKYNFSIASHIGSLSNTINRLEAIQTYLTLTISLPKSFKEKGITEEEWILYHYSSYILSIVGIYDVAVYLVSSVARFDIESSPRFEIDVRNKIKEDNRFREIKKALDSLKSNIGPYKEQRNLYLHKGKVPSSKAFEKIRFIETYQMFHNMFAPDKKKSTKKMPYIRVVLNMQKEIEKESEKLCSCIENLFSALMPIYDYNLDASQREDASTS